MKRWHYVVLGIVAILIITNPSATEFKTYLGRSGYVGIKRPVNLFVCSVYTYYEREYLGVVGNFWVLGKSKPVARLNPIDSAMMADSTKTIVSDTSNHVAKTDEYGIPIKKK